MQMPKARNPRLKLRRKRTPEQEASDQKSKHGKPETPPTAEPNEKGAKEEITHGPGITGPPIRILLLDASIREDAEIQRKLKAGDYDPPWEHKSPAQATFTIELSIANKQADANKVRRSKPTKDSGYVPALRSLQRVHHGKTNRMHKRGS